MSFLLFWILLRNLLQKCSQKSFTIKMIEIIRKKDTIEESLLSTSWELQKWTFFDSQNFVFDLIYFTRELSTSLTKKSFQNFLLFVILAFLPHPSYWNHIHACAYFTRENIQSIQHFTAQWWHAIGWNQSRGIKWGKTIGGTLSWSVQDGTRGE